MIDLTSMFVLPATGQVRAVLSYTASGRPRRNSAPLNVVSPPKPRRQITAEQLPSPPPTPPPLREAPSLQEDSSGVIHNENTESDLAVSSGDENAPNDRIQSSTSTSSTTQQGFPIELEPLLTDPSDPVTASEDNSAVVEASPKPHEGDDRQRPSNDLSSEVSAVVNDLTAMVVNIEQIEGDVNNRNDQSDENNCDDNNNNNNDNNSSNNHHQNDGDLKKDAADKQTLMKKTENVDQKEGGRLIEDERPLQETAM